MSSNNWNGRTHGMVLFFLTQTNVKFKIDKRTRKVINDREK